MEAFVKLRKAHDFVEKLLLFVLFYLFCKILLIWDYKSESIPPNFPVAVFPSDTVTTEGNKHPAPFISIELSRVLERQFLLYLYSIMLNVLWNEKQVFPRLLLKYCSFREITYLLQIFWHLRVAVKYFFFFFLQSLKKAQQKTTPKSKSPNPIPIPSSTPSLPTVFILPHPTPVKVQEACSFQTRWGRLAHNISLRF